MTYSYSGRSIASLMRRHKVTIRQLSQRMGITQKRIREIRNSQLTNPHIARDWVEAITGNDPGHAPADPRQTLPSLEIEFPDGSKETVSLT